MFNFKYQQRAFNELNAEQFRVVYLLNSTLSMTNKTNNTPDNNKIEMYNGYMMDKLGLSERHVQPVVLRRKRIMITVLNVDIHFSRYPVPPNTVSFYHT